MEMTNSAIRDTIKQHDLYFTPELNNQLYLHHRGFASIKNLETFTGLTILWLHGNEIETIENLNCQKELRALYLQDNNISKIQHLCCCQLDTINLSKNYINTIENLSHLHNLTTLILSHNNLSSVQSIAQVTTLPNLNLLDLEHNKIDGGESNDQIIKIFASCPKLKVLRLAGNKFINSIEYYRKTMVYNCRELGYLDDYPVKKYDRRCYDIWWAEFLKSGSIEDSSNAEKMERRLLKEERQMNDEENYLFLLELQKEHDLLTEERIANDEENHLFFLELQNESE